MTTVSLIYVYWPNQPFGVTWCDLPWALRDAGLPKRLTAAGHEVLESVVMSEDATPEDLLSGFKLAGHLAADVAKARAEGELPVILCGSCALAAVGAVAGLGGGADVGIAWCDAHPDLNTPETTESGLLEGMALSIATGRAWRQMAQTWGRLSPAALANTVLYGVRDIEPAEQSLITSQSLPIATSAAEINQRLAHVTSTYLHIDMDVHDAINVRANAYAVPNGPSTEQVRETITAIDKLAAVAITGLDPAATDSKRATQIAVDHIIALANAAGRS